MFSESPYKPNILPIINRRNCSMMYDEMEGRVDAGADGDQVTSVRLWWWTGYQDMDSPD